jgi:biotin carboxylase
VDNQSGRGVSVVRNPAGLPQAIAEAFANSRRQAVLVQEFVAGLEVIVDSIVCAGVVHCLGIAAKLPYADNPTVSERITYSVADLPVPALVVREVNARLLQALAVRQGLVHAEYMLAEGRVVPIDVAARGGGVHIYPLVLPHVSGVDAMRVAIELALGRPCAVQPRSVPRAANIEFLRAGSGRIAAIEGLDEARVVPGVALLHLNQQVGDDTGPLHNKDQRLGHVVALADTAAEAVAASGRAARAVRVQLR